MIEMFLSTFVILGPRVQNVGYRPFLVGKFQNFDLQGKVWNDSTSLAVEVEVYGRKRNIEAFYDFVMKYKPKGAKIEYITKPSFKKTRQNPFFRIMTQTGYLTIEQLSKGVEYQKQLIKGQKELPLKIARELKAVIS